jgi:hypothetical protein
MYFSLIKFQGQTISMLLPTDYAIGWNRFCVRTRRVFV